MYSYNNFSFKLKGNISLLLIARKESGETVASVIDFYDGRGHL